jgi:hypothetical protein
MAVEADPGWDVSEFVDLVDDLVEKGQRLQQCLECRPGRPILVPPTPGLVDPTV